MRKAITHEGDTMTTIDFPAGTYEVTIGKGNSTKRFGDAVKLAKRCEGAEYNAGDKVWIIPVSNDSIHTRSNLHSLVNAYGCTVERISDDDTAEAEEMALIDERMALMARLAEIDKRLAELSE